MRKIIPVAFLVVSVFVILGCSSIKRNIDYYEACKGDVECFAKMQRAKTVSSQVVASIPAPFGSSEPLQVIVGCLASALAGSFYGRKLCKKKI